jgi:hypothetical protein
LLYRVVAVQLVRSILARVDLLPSSVVMRLLVFATVCLVVYPQFVMAEKLTWLECKGVESDERQYFARSGYVGEPKSNTVSKSETWVFDRRGIRFPAEVVGGANFQCEIINNLISCIYEPGSPRALGDVTVRSAGVINLNRVSGSLENTRWQRMQFEDGGYLVSTITFRADCQKIDPKKRKF